MPARFEEIQVRRVVTRFNVRTRITTDGLADIAGSIRQRGVQQPIIVYEEDGMYVLVAGERRWRGSIEAGRETIPAIILDTTLDKADTLLVQCMENMQREELGCVDIARGLKELMRCSGCTACEAAEKLGYTPASASRFLRLLELPEDILIQVEAGRITLSAAYAIARVPDGGHQKQLASEAASGKLSREALARKIKRIQRGAKSSRLTPVLKFRTQLGARQSVVIAAPELGMPVIVTLLTRALEMAKTALVQGMSPEDFAKSLKNGRLTAEGGAA